MAPLEPLAGSVELATEPDTTHRQRSLSVSSQAAQAYLSSSITSLRSGGAASSQSHHHHQKGGAGGIHALKARLGLGGLARRTLGITLLLVTVCLWTTSNFLASYIFSDHTYDKPFFVVYINTSVFALSLVPMFVRFVAQHGVAGVRAEARALLRREKHSAGAARGSRDDAGRGLASSKTTDEEAHGLLSAAADDREREDEDDYSSEGGEMGSSSVFDVVDTPAGEEAAGGGGGGEKLSLRETAVLSLEFCMLWFCANYFASACLEYTSVGSVTILTSTSSVWTLVFCAAMGVEGFSYRKLVGVLASLAGVVLISTVDLSGRSDEDRGSFPHKSQASIAVGDGMAFFSAIVYGLYVTVMKRRVGDEDRVNMQLFFWPGGRV